MAGTKHIELRHNPKRGAQPWRALVRDANGEITWKLEWQSNREDVMEQAQELADGLGLEIEEFTEGE